jgi:hypothetical protein
VKIELTIDERKRTMTGSMTTTRGGALATSDANPYTAYGDKVGLRGTFLTFKNGEFLYGQEGASIPLGTRMVANMKGFRVGWRRWMDNKVMDDLTELLSDMIPQQPRSALGDMDSQMWERDLQGKARDPWQFTNILELVDEQGEIFIYSTGAKGGINALGRLCKQYGNLFKQKPGMAPILELGADFYMHTEYGKTWVPVFKITGWADEATLATEEPETAEAVEDDDIPFDQATAARDQAIAAQKAAQLQQTANAQSKVPTGTVGSGLAAGKKAPKF